MQEIITGINLTVEEYAKLRGCTPQYICKLCSNGKISTFLQKGVRARGGKSYLIPLATLPNHEIKRYLKNHKKQELFLARKEESREENVIDLDYERLSIEQREELNIKNKILDGWIKYRQEEKKRGNSLTDADDNYIRIIKIQYPERSISLRTIHRWDEIRRRNGEAALVDSRGRHGRHQSKMKQEIFDIFEYYYLDESRKSATLCMTLTKMELKQRGMETEELPSMRTFLRWVDKIPDPVLQFFRYGEKACKDKCLPYIHRNYEDLYSNDIWVSDNHTFDIIIQKEEKPLRVYLTAFLDVRSRKIVGYYVTLNPSSDATLYALRRGIEKYGIPKRILTDNGREFLTYDIGGRGFRKQANSVDPHTIMERLGIDFRTALVKNARSKIIERTFLTVKNEFSKMFEAYTGGNTLERPERLKYIQRDLSKLVVFQDFESFVEQYIEGYYNYRTHSGIGMNGMTPNQAFKKYMVEQRRASADVLNIMLMRSTRLQKVTRSGVKLDFYGQDIYFVDEDMIINHQGEKVFVRYNPSDLSSVRVYDDNDRYMLTAYQDKKLSYFASKEEIAEKMKEQRHYQTIVKSYMKDKGIKASKALDLIMEQARENLRVEEDLSPDIIRILRSPDLEFNEMYIRQQAVGADVIDWSVANKRIKEYGGK